LGLINYKAKGDFTAARADFQRFIEHADESQFAKQIEIARIWIGEIDAAQSL
jgi:TolA-binding protein